MSTQRNLGMKGAPKGENGKFEVALLKARSFSDLREMHRQGKLTESPEGSLAFILKGNERHVEKLGIFRLQPADRMEKIEANEVELLLLYCSDARMVAVDDEKSPISLHIRVAGNALAEEGPSLEEIIDAAKHLEEDGVLVIISHGKCGAVSEYSKWVDGGKKPTGSKSLDFLLSKAMAGKSPESNALAQAARSMDLLALDSSRIAILHYDWDTEDGVSVVMDNTDGRQVAFLMNKMELAHKRAGEDRDLSADLATQTPHAMVVGADNLPFSIPTITGAEQDELFCTTGSRHGLDHMDVASIFYASEHLHQNHLVFIAPGKEGDTEEIEEMFRKWRTDLCKEPGLRNRLDSGELILSRLRYDVDTGRLHKMD